MQNSGRSNCLTKDAGSQRGQVLAPGRLLKKTIHTVFQRRLRKALLARNSENTRYGQLDALTDCNTNAKRKHA